MKAFRRDKGAVLVAVLIMAVIVALFCVTSLLVSQIESQGTNAGILRDKAFFVASAGLEDEFQELSDLMAKSSLADPFKAFEAMAGQTVINHRPLASDGVTVGQYDVVVNSVSVADTCNRDIMLTATGYVPSADDPRALRRTITVVVRVGTTRSQVFDYVYFINNWGWYYGNTIVANGNVRANGQFDFGGYSPTVNRLPRFDGMTGGVVGDPLDAGGVYAGWNIVGNQNVKGSAVGSQYMHPFDGQIPMPNLTDLTMYENLAKTNNSDIKIAGTVMCNSIVGDEPGELPNLYLEGKDINNPIVLNGPVVVRGNLIIKGYVKGKGALYVQGNVYIAGNLTYCTPVEATPATADKTAVESWVQRNQSADALGLFAREHIVVGNYTDPKWQSYVSQWVGDYRNRSGEDAGEDGIQNTRAGRDGIPGTADDDVLESDGKWTVQYYTAEDGQNGRIPAGYSVGSVIPGSGEDIDGDGVYDLGTRMSDFSLTVPLDKPHWQGNFPALSGTLLYKNICPENKIYRLDGAFYTNHSFAFLTLASDKDLTVNGCLVSRNEDIIYGTKHAIFNYDLRLLEGNNPHALILPQTWKPLQMVMWRSD